MSKSKNEIVAELNRIEVDSVYSAKGHFNTASSWRRWNYSFGIPAAIASAVAGVSALSSFDNHDLVAAVLAVAVAVLTSLMTFLNPSDQAATHHAAGNRYNSLKNRSRIAANVEATTLSVAELASRMSELALERDELNEQSPQIPRRAFERAQSGIAAGEASYDSDESGANDG